MRLVSWTLLIYSDVAIFYPHLKVESCIQMVLQCLITPTTQKIGNTITLISEKKMYVSYLFSAQKVRFPLRFDDRDMVMWYHWGLGIEHVYAHVKRPTEDNESDGQPMLEQPTKAEAAEAAVTQVMTSNPSPATGNNGSSLVEPTGQPLNICSNRSEGNPAKIIKVGEAEEEDQLEDQLDSDDESDSEDGLVSSDDVDNFASDYYMF